MKHFLIVTSLVGDYQSKQAISSKTGSKPTQHLASNLSTERKVMSISLIRNFTKRMSQQPMSTWHVRSGRHGNFAYEAPIYSVGIPCGHALKSWLLHLQSCSLHIAEYGWVLQPLHPYRIHSKKFLVLGFDWLSSGCRGYWMSDQRRKTSLCVFPV